MQKSRADEENYKKIREFHNLAELKDKLISIDNYWTVIDSS